jgi:hypothetical protein
MSPNEVRSLTNVEILGMLVSLRPGADEAVSWLASVIADPVMVAGVGELSRRYVAGKDGNVGVQRAKSAGTVLIDGARFKHLMWLNRIAMNQIGPMIGKCDGWGSVIAHKGHMSYWAADAIATEIGMHVDAFIEAIASSEELQRLTA